MSLTTSRYGSGFYLHAKVNLNPPPEPEVTSPKPRKLSFIRQFSQQSHGSGSPRSPDGHKPKRFSFKRQGSRGPVEGSEALAGADPET